MKAVNLIPPEQRRGGAGGAGRSGGAAYALLGGLAVILVALATWVLTQNSVTTNKAELTRVTNAANAAQAEAAALKPYRDFAALRAARVLTVQSLARSRFDWERAFTDFARVIPSNVWLTTLTATVKPGVNFGGSGGGSGGGGGLRPVVGLAGVSQCVLTHLVHRSGSSAIRPTLFHRTARPLSGYRPTSALRTRSQPSSRRLSAMVIDRRM